MFRHYESEKDQREREAAKNEPKPAPQAGGVTRQRGWRSKQWDAFWRKNNVVYMPLNTAWVKFRSASGRGGIPEPKLSDIDIKVKDLAHLEAALQQARNVMLMTHNGIEDFTFETQENRLEDINLRIRNARVSGGIIAGLSLLVGGIGIMNIMLASITERIREIGTCKAIGASPAAIFLQVLVEGCVLAGLGGLAGITTSFGLVACLDRLSSGGNAPVITVMPMIAAVAFSVTVGVGGEPVAGRESRAPCPDSGPPVWLRPSTVIRGRPGNTWTGRNEGRRRAQSLAGSGSLNRGWRPRKPTNAWVYPGERAVASWSWARFRRSCGTRPPARSG
jgi:putative ABC transport system permease protein